MKAFTLLFVIILICSCSVTKNNNKDQVFEIIDFENSLNNSNAIKTYISEIADEIEYIELETKRNNIIGKIGDIKIHGDTLVILDSTTKELLLFNKKGQFLNKIGSIGKGPGEYVQITTWDIDQQNKSILLYDNKLQKFIKFSMNGILLEERKTDFRPMSIRFSNNSDLFLFHPVPFNVVYGNGFSFQLLDSRWNNIKELLVHNIDEIKNTDIMTWKKIYNFHDSLTYWESYYDTIYRIKSQRVIPKFIINLGRKKIPRNIARNAASWNANFTKYDILYNVFETNKLMFFEVSRNGIYRKFIYNKYNKDLWYLLKDPIFKNLETGIYDNIDGGLPIWPEKTTVDGNSLIDYFDIYDLQTFPSVKNSLLKILKNSEDNNNPIIRIVKLKK